MNEGKFTEEDRDKLDQTYKMVSSAWFFLFIYVMYKWMT
jgi:hypothetical protein